MRRTHPHHIANLCFTLVFAIVFRGLGKAQEITANELLAPVGSNFHQYGIVDLFPWDTLQGPDVTWDYAWTEVDSTNDITYAVIDLTEAPDVASYPTADRVVRSTGGTNDDYVIDRFYDQGSTHLSELGSVGPVLSYVFDTPEVVFGIPMALGDTLRSDYCFWSDGLGSQFHFCGESYVTFDAIGTLHLPYGTFNNVKHVTHWRSSFETTEPATDSTHFVKQQWFAPGSPYPILEVGLFIDDIGQLYPNGWLMDQASLTSIAEGAAATPWTSYPNPTTGRITIQRSTFGSASIAVLSTDGHVLHTERFTQGSQFHQLSLDELPNGIYVVRITDGEGNSTQRVVKDTPR